MSSRPVTVFLLLLVFLLAGQVLPACATTGPGQSGEVAVLRSPPTLKVAGWRGEWDLQGAGSVLKRLGVAFRWLEPGELEAGSWRGQLLVLPDVRLMSAATAEAVRQHVRSGGRILATGQTSYRDEENRPLQPAGFRLGDLFGGDFHRWSGVSPKSTALNLGPELGGGAVALGRPEAMLVRVRPEARVLAALQDPESSAAILETPAGIYVGVSLLAPENSDSEQVARLVGRLLERLLPGWRSPRQVAPAARPGPQLKVGEEFAAGPEVAVGLSALEGEARVSAAQGVAWDGGRAREVRIRGIDTLGKPPAVALYDGSGHLLCRSERPLRLRGRPFLELSRVNPNGTYRWSAWRGDLRLEPGFQTLGLTNLVPLEGYLAGVVPNEMPPWFPPEALRAMAVVARTFTVAHLGRHSTQGFDLCSTVHCHVYEGLATESPKTGEAVRRTRGEVLLLDGKPVDATYHAVCGGIGEAPQAVWPGAGALACLPGGPDTVHPLPEAVDLSREEDLREFLDHPPDAWCARASRFRWEETWSLQELERKFAESLPRLLGNSAMELGRLRRVEVSRRTPHGRVATLRLQGERGSVEVQGDAVRWLVSGGRIGAGGLQSTLFYVEQAQGRVRFRGGGWGHGVGLCQEGAAGRAQGGQGYREILEHYYPGATLEAEDQEGGSLQR